MPSALRGVHAWLAFFCPRVADQCIQADPYGILRYGDTERLSHDQARRLISALAALAEEDPYFRSEDWNARAVSALARPELKPDILKLLTAEKRPFHLSSLLLEGIKGSPLAHILRPLCWIFCSRKPLSRSSGTTPWRLWSQVGQG